MFSVNPRVSLGLIIFIVLIRTSAKTVESPQRLSEKFAHRTSLGSSDFPSGLCPIKQTNLDLWSYFDLDLDLWSYLEPL